MDYLTVLGFSLSGIFWFVILVLPAIIKNIEEKKKEEKLQKEIDEWMLNDEPKYRNLHTYPDDWFMRRRVIARKYNYTCQNCGRRGYLGFHAHHIVHLSEGGDNSLNNLIFLCRWCHENQHPHMLEERKRRYKRSQEFYKKAQWKAYWAKKRSRQ